MKCLLACLSTVLLACACAAAQTPASGAVAPATAATPEPGVTSTVSPEVAQFQKIEDSWSDAVNRRDQDKSLSLTQKVITVRMLGDIAVANGTYTLHHKVNAAEVDEKGVFTHVFERVRGGWLCINSQRTVLVRDANSKQKKQSTTDSPFHIPFLTRGDKGPQ